MPYEGLGLRHTAPATKAVRHGFPTIEQGFVGTAFKVEQAGRFENPATLGQAGGIDEIGVGEEFEIQVGGIHEVARSGNLATADVGAAAVSDIYINSANNTLGLAAQALTGAVLNAGWQKFGKVTERDTTRTPQVLRVNSNHLELVRGTMP